MWKYLLATAAIALRASPLAANTTGLTVAAGQPVSCSNNGWMTVVVASSGSEALIFCQRSGQRRVPLSQIKCPNASDRLRFTTNVVTSGIVVDGQRRPTDARFHCYPRHPAGKPE